MSKVLGSLVQKVTWAALLGVISLPIAQSAIAWEISSPESDKQRNSCTISGQISGAEMESDRLTIVVINPKNGEALGQYPVRSPSYSIDLNRPGHYVLRVFRFSGGSLFPTGTNPGQREIECRGEPVDNANFSLQ